MILNLLLRRIRPPLIAIVANGWAQTGQILLRLLVLVEGSEVWGAARGNGVLVKVGNGGEIFKLLDLVLNSVCTHPLVKGAEFFLIWSIATSSLSLKITFTRNRKSLRTFHRHEWFLMLEFKRPSFEAVHRRDAFLASGIITCISLLRHGPHRKLNKLYCGLITIRDRANRLVSIQKRIDLLTIGQRRFPRWFNGFLLSAAQSHYRVTCLQNKRN